MNATEPDSIPDEAALLAAPPEDYMSARQLVFFRARLLAQRAELMQAADQTLQTLRDRDTVNDELDQARLQEDYALELRMRDRDRKLLRKIDGALLRIERGEYGWCAETGEPIGLARLLARPTATLSVEGQERKEKRERVVRR